VKKLLLLLWILILIFILAAQESGISVTNSFTSQSQVFFAPELPDAEAALSWKPELFAEYFPLPRLRLSAELSMDNSLRMVFDGEGSSQELDFEPYRAWGGISYRSTELKAGLQHIRMGVAQIHRPLQWFDTLVPGSMLRESEGVKAITLTHFFPNPDLRLWAMPAKDEAKGAELLASRDGTWEFGGRMGWINPLGETGLSYHHREVEDFYSGEGVAEHRLGLDQRVDGFMGGWLEVAYTAQDEAILALTPMGYQELPKNRMSLTLGGDYTFDIGNGLYVLMEQNVQLQGPNAVQYDETRFYGAFLMNYPLGVLDGLHFLASYEYKEQRGIASVSWRRAYDYLSWDLSLILDAGYPAILSRAPALSLTINYEI